MHMPAGIVAVTALLVGMPGGVTGDFSVTLNLKTAASVRAAVPPGLSR